MPKTNSIKYTKDFVLKEIQGLLKELKENKDIIYIGELFEDKDYTRQRYFEWTSEPIEGDKVVTRYGDDAEVKRISYTIKEILETRAIKGAMNNKLNPTSVIFHLKNNYKWVDKQEIEQKNTNLNLNKDMSEYSDEEIDKLIHGE